MTSPIFPTILQSLHLCPGQQSPVRIACILKNVFDANLFSLISAASTEVRSPTEFGGFSSTSPFGLQLGDCEVVDVLRVKVVVQGITLVLPGPSLSPVPPSHLLPPTVESAVRCVFGLPATDDRASSRPASPGSRALALCLATLRVSLAGEVSDSSRFRPHTTRLDRSGFLIGRTLGWLASNSNHLGRRQARSKTVPMTGI
ncbi:unnamed protein product [Schistocephalus solidus]|uniref:Uncharacterized protein n=1 Tax=Schistocephalus solidus TaxID=70667 RepID=A0A183S9J9_SCHSO|nr:unnamed protein product [Schistocephalus solidus]